ANMNFDSIQSEEVLTGGMDAEYNSMGGVINLITNAGSDEWKIDSSFYLNNAAFSASHQFGPKIYHGVEPFNTGTLVPNSKYQGNINFGGPIIKHKWWFNAS